MLRLSQELQCVRDEKEALLMTTFQRESEDVEKLSATLASLTAERDQLRTDLQENVEMVSCCFYSSFVLLFFYQVCVKANFFFCLFTDDCESGGTEDGPGAKRRAKEADQRARRTNIEAGWASQ